MQKSLPDFEESITAPELINESLPEAIPQLTEQVALPKARTAESVTQESAAVSESLEELPGSRSIPAELPVTPGRPLITLPSIQEMQQATQAVNDADAARSWVFECSLLQEEDGLHTCERGSDSAYQLVERNPSYEALNPVREYSRSERTSKSVYQNTGVIAGALESSSVPIALREYVVSELEAGTSLFTNNGTSNDANMRRMTDRSAAAQQAERVLGDSWIRGRAAELQQRKVQAE